MLSNSTFENRRNIYTYFIDDKTNIDEVFFAKKHHIICSIQNKALPLQCDWFTTGD